MLVPCGATSSAKHAFRCASALLFGFMTSGVYVRCEEKFRAFGGAVIPSVDEESLRRLGTSRQMREPMKFWVDQRVQVKSGIVVEDKDYVIRSVWWRLPSRNVGVVQQVSESEKGARCTVLFPDRDGWEEHPLDKQALARDRTEPEKLAGTVVALEHVDGLAVDPWSVGVVVSDEDGGILVELPVSIIRLEEPQVRDRVIRGPDWSGYADGGDSSYGLHAENPDRFFGTVVSRRDDDGNCDVEWELTGRITSMRFDSLGGYYEIVKMPGESDDSSDD